MARSAIPNPLERRHLVEGDIDPARALRIAREYLEEDRALEAVDFLAKAEAHEDLVALRGRALNEGDVFLLRAVAAAQGEAVTHDEWQRVADAAAAAGKERYVEAARRQADRGED